VEEGVAMKYVWMILRTDLVSVLNKSKGGTKDKLQLALLPILWLVLAGGAFYGTRLFFRYLEPYLAAIPGMADAVALKFLNSVAVYVILFVFLGGFQTTFRIIYESDDIGFLLSQPVPSHSVFAAKFITAYLALLPMVLIFGGSTWFAWGSFNRAGLGFYVMVMLSFMLLLLLIHGAIALLLLLAMR
jgi:ABC-type transport system involved in multi-copper enzyme maturation permease subunit